MKHPERKIQKELIKLLELKSWMVKQTHGNMYQSGFPDLFATHKLYGQRWIEVKLPNMKGSRFTKAQLKDFPEFILHGCGIWILTAATVEEYSKLFRPENLTLYFREHYI